MTPLTTVAVLLSGLAASAAARRCKEIVIPVTISSTNQAFRLSAPSTSIEGANVLLNYLQPGSTYVAEITEGTATVSGSYNIAATYCEPCGGAGKALQVLTHGFGFDRSYWDFPFNNYNYSYVNRALERGYSTLFYDRLSVGKSSHGETVNELQSLLEVETLRALTEQLRQGSVPGVSAKFDRIFHVGHSFGSGQTYGLSSKYPDLTDGIALTGFAQNADFIPLFGFGANFVLAKTLPELSSYTDGYLAMGDATSVQVAFFGPGEFDPAILDAVTAARQPVSIGELLTFSNPVSTLNAFEGPVLVVTGDRDLPFCGGSCSLSTPSIPAQVQQFFTNTSNFEAVIIPNAGHGLNFEYSHPTTYGAILDFFDKHA